MLKPVIKAFALMLVILAAYTCIDPYNPELDDYRSLLVVEGLMTDENIPYEIRLSRSVQDEDSVPDRINGALVSISDESGKTTWLEDYGNGLYKTDPASFTGTIGKKYILNIKTPEGEEYQSDPAVMLPVPELENVYYEKSHEYGINQSEILEGIRIFVDTGNGDGDNVYLRWEYEETWKFRLSDFKRFNYINDSVILPITDTKDYCWKTAKSSSVMNGVILPGSSTQIRKAPVCFIASSESDRLLIQYSILVRQYSLSEEAYRFWNDLRQVNETGGTIFDKQPFSVVSNIHNINDPKEKVLGYFQVSAVKQVRKYITGSELTDLKLPWFSYECKRYEVDPLDYHVEGSMVPLMTWDELYVMFTGEGRYIFVEPIYDEMTKKLSSLVFTESECADCELTGTSEKPEWWIDQY